MLRTHLASVPCDLFSELLIFSHLIIVKPGSYQILETMIMRLNILGPLRRCSSTVRLEGETTRDQLTLEASAMILLISGESYTFNILKRWITLSNEPV